MLGQYKLALIMSIIMSESLWSSLAEGLCGLFLTGESLLILLDYYSSFPLGNTKLISCFADSTDPNICRYEMISVFS